MTNGPETLKAYQLDGGVIFVIEHSEAYKGCDDPRTGTPTITGLYHDVDQDIVYVRSPYTDQLGRLRVWIDADVKARMLDELAGWNFPAEVREALENYPV